MAQFLSATWHLLTDLSVHSILLLIWSTSFSPYCFSFSGFSSLLLSFQVNYKLLDSDKSDSFFCPHSAKSTVSLDLLIGSLEEPTFQLGLEVRIPICCSVKGVLTITPGPAP